MMLPRAAARRAGSELPLLLALPIDFANGLANARHSLTGNEVRAFSLFGLKGHENMTALSVDKRGSMKATGCPLYFHS